MDISKLTNILSDSLKSAIQDIVKDATDPALTRLTLDIAAHTIQLAQLPPGPEKDALMQEHKGSLKMIAEKHRVDLTQTAAAQLRGGVDVGFSLLSGIVLSKL